MQASQRGWGIIDEKYYSNEKPSYESVKKQGFRYAIVQKPKNRIRVATKTIYQAASNYFGFFMSDVSVFIYDVVDNRIIEPKEFENEFNEIARKHGL